MKKQPGSASPFEKFLDLLERVCNRLPPPAILFFYLFFFVAVLSALLCGAEISVVSPVTGEPVTTQNFFSSEGLLWLLGSMVTNFTSFAPLGLVVTMTLAIGLCEESGLVLALLSDRMKGISPRVLPFAVAFTGVVGNIASDTAMVVIPPIAGVLYLAAGKHPVAGMICGYAGAQAGFAANLMISGTDSLLQGITNTALDAFYGDGALHVNAACNYYFMAASTFLCAGVIGLVCERIVEPRLGEYQGEEKTAAALHTVSAKEKRALRLAGAACALFLLFIAALYFFGPLGGRDDAGNRVFASSPLLAHLIPILFFFFSVPGLVFGFSSGAFKTPRDVAAAMSKQLGAMGGYFVFCFFCGQFNALFSWTRLGTILAVAGADGLEGAGFTGIGLCLSFLLLTGIINLVMPSGAAKWAILAPVFVPLLTMLGYHPAFAQLLYRLGDSPTNAFTPLSSYLWVTLDTARAHYDKKLEIGTLAAGLFPIGIILQVVWILFLVLWIALALPIGPGVFVYLGSA